MVTQRNLTTPEQHQLRIARDTLRMAPAMRGVMGGPTLEQAVATIQRLTGALPVLDVADRAIIDAGIRCVFGGTLAEVTDAIERRY